YGMGLAIARFINGYATPDIVDTYKKTFIPSESFPEPKVALSMVILCADTEEKAMRLKKAVDYQFLQIDKRNFEGISDYEDIKDYKFSLMDRELLKAHRGKVIYGTKEQVKKELTELANAFDAEEIIAVAWAASFEDRKRSFELLAEMF
ncbi:MAG TPA: LLM class flavin-dependent oxidoreductase, partial [Cytophagaceae bacterium]